MKYLKLFEDIKDIDPFDEDEWDEEEFKEEVKLGIVPFETLVGKIITNIENLTYEMIFHTNDGVYKMYHEQDCCESVEVDDIVGDLDDIMNSPIVRATEDSNNDPLDGDENDGYDSHTWTFYNITTKKGHVTIRWFGSSNGYYSESVDFRRIK